MMDDEEDIDWTEDLPVPIRRRWAPTRPAASWPGCSSPPPPPPPAWGCGGTHNRRRAPPGCRWAACQATASLLALTCRVAALREVQEQYNTMNREYLKAGLTTEE